MTLEEIKQAEIRVQGFEPSPWFKPTDPPVRVGKYQLKDWVGVITEAEWNGAEFMRGGWAIPVRLIRCWRGVVA